MAKFICDKTEVTFERNPNFEQFDLNGIDFGLSFRFNLTRIQS